MRSLLVLALLVLPCSVWATIWPAPAHLDTGNLKRCLAGPASSTLSLTDDSSKLPSDLHKAFERMLHSIDKSPLTDYPARTIKAEGEGQALKHVKVVIKPSSDKRKQEAFEQPNDLAASSSSSIAEEIQRKVQKLDEAYALKVPKSGPIVIESASALGAFRGLTTLEQLFYTTSHSKGKSSCIYHAPIEIRDRPAYPYRGLLIDTARNYYTIDELKHQLNSMAFVKLNQFHWHISDTQSFPLQLPGKLSVLSEKGAYSPQEVYTPKDVADLTSYAAERGINVNVEIDMPSHTYEGVYQYDRDLLACPDYRPWENWANEPPSGALRLNSTKVYKYVAELMTAVAKLFPGPYVSHGNDEVDLACAGAKEKKDVDASQLRPFVEHVQKTLNDHGKTPMVWEEALLDFPETGQALVPGTLVQAWTTPDNVEAILAARDDVYLLHSPTPYFYLDCGRGTFLTNTTAQSYCEYVTWGKQYTFDPTNGTTTANVHRVLGGEAALWGEQSDGSVADGLIWPRTGAAAEVFWTGKSFEKNGKKHRLSLTEAMVRLNELRYRLVSRGVRAMPLQPKWCIAHPEACKADNPDAA